LRVLLRILLEPPGKKFKKGTVETFNIEAIDVGKVKKIEVIAVAFSYATACFLKL